MQKYRAILLQPVVYEFTAVNDGVAKQLMKGHCDKLGKVDDIPATLHSILPLPPGDDDYDEPDSGPERPAA